MKRIKVILQLTDAQFSKLEAVAKKRWKPGDRKGFRPVVERLVLEAIGERPEAPSDTILVRVNPEYTEGPWWKKAESRAKRDALFAESLARVKTSPEGAMVPMAWLVQARALRTTGWCFRPVLFEGKLPPMVYGKTNRVTPVQFGVAAEVHKAIAHEAARLGVPMAVFVRSLVSSYVARPKALDLTGLDYGPLAYQFIVKLPLDLVAQVDNLAAEHGMKRGDMLRAIVTCYLRGDYRRLRKIDFHPRWGKFANAQKTDAA